METLDLKKPIENSAAEVQVQKLEEFNHQITELLNRLETKVKQPDDNSIAEFQEAKTLLDQTQLSGMDVVEYKGKFVSMINEYYSDKLVGVVDGLADKIGKDASGACLLIDKIAELIHQAGTLGLDISENFYKIQNNLAAAENNHLAVAAEKEQFIRSVSRYYDDVINDTLGHLEEKMRDSRPEALFLLTKVDLLLTDAKRFGVDMPEEHQRLDELKKMSEHKIKL